ncbi:MAG: long-chain fatty acid--CoA ligase [Novosphingobium sp.]|nr:long-chain fatty acid--CoA ligase [Novosphingobium sp.]MBO9603864.1 long-chain fatty acid--CoA ligase [Novosphingobium sp.]
MLGQMQDWELRLPTLLDHAAREHGTREIVSHWADGSRTRSNWAGVRHDALRLSQALRRMGLGGGCRVATLAMNHLHHLSAFYGIVGAGAVLHTLNPRLFDDQLDYIANHAEDRVLLYDAAFAPLVERLRPRWPTIEQFVCFDDLGGGRGEYEALLSGEDGQGEWATGDERESCHLCYTSGTTGNPKGVLYTHRSSMLHALASLQPAILGLEPRSVFLPVVPLFHAAGWGLAWSCAAAGAKLVLSAVNEPAVLCDLLTSERVTHMGGVPTVWLAMFGHLDATGQTPPALERAIVGGSAMPPATIARLMEAGVKVMHAWGMTETSPIGTAGAEHPEWAGLGFEERVGKTALQGRVPYGVELRCVDLDGSGRELPRDGRSPGALQVRGPWVVQRYFGAEEDAVGPGGWFDTGDVGIIHPDGTLQLTDRTKDVIKSGGEWISSVELENAAVGHPDVAEAAAIGIAHPRWDERPLLVVVRKPGRTVEAEDIRRFLSTRVAKWWLPDAVEFVAELPHGATGKIAKQQLRAAFRGYSFPD